MVGRWERLQPAIYLAPKLTHVPRQEGSSWIFNQTAELMNWASRPLDEEKEKKHERQVFVGQHPESFIL